MSQLREIKLQQQTLDAVQTLALEQHRTVEDIIDDTVKYGVNVMRQRLFFQQRKERAKTVNVAKVLEMLKEVGKDNPPDTGDEIPEELKEWVEAQRSR